MRIAIVGPAHPYKGGIPQHTTELAHHLRAAGHEVSLISWRNQYPFFYPGEQFVPDDKPELPVFSDVKRVLSWRNPVGWLRWGRRLRSYDEVIFVWWVPMIQGPVYLSMLKALGKKGPRTTILCHNVIQHSAGPADKQLTQRVFKQAGRILVHTEALAEQVRTLTNTPVVVAAMPAHLPGGQPKRRATPGKLQHRLLFFGLVRRYKGVDTLLHALAEVPAIRLVVAGEMWGKQKAALEQLVSELRLGDRVELQPGYVPAEAIGDLFMSSDALVLPYRAGTATQNVELAFAHGRPVIATTVGSMPQQIRDGIDGLLCAPENPAELAACIRRFYEPGVANSLQANVPTTSSEADWQYYVSVLSAA